MPSKSRSKFWVGQVICLPKGPLQPRNRYGKIQRIDDTAIQTTDGYWYKPQVRPLTKHEMNK